MKLTATTSSLLLASMALSPSLASAAPTGMEAPTSPNPGAVSPNVHQFSSSPHIESASKMNRAPALRTGPGSPRRSIPPRTHKVNKRDGPLLPLVPLLDSLTGLPIVGSVISGLTGLGIHKDNAAGQAVNSAESVPTQSGVQSRLASSTNLLGSNLPVDPQQVSDGLFGPGGLSGVTGFISPDAAQQSSGSPRNPLDGLERALPFNGALGGVTGSLPFLPGDSVPPARYLPPFESPIPGSPSLPGLAGLPSWYPLPAAPQTPDSGNGCIIVLPNGVRMACPSSWGALERHVPDTVGGRVSEESAPSPSTSEAAPESPSPPPAPASSPASEAASEAPSHPSPPISSPASSSGPGAASHSSPVVSPSGAGAAAEQVATTKTTAIAEAAETGRNSGSPAA